MDKDVISAVLAWLKDHAALAETGCELERLPTDGTDGTMLQSLPGDPVITRYRSGGYVAQYPFAVVVRTGGSDTASRLNAMEVLGALWADIESGSKPEAPEGFDFVGLVIRTTPARVAVGDSGYEDYQATFALTYRKRG